MAGENTKENLYDVKRIIERDLDVIKSTQERNEVIVKEAKATVDEIRREATVTSGELTTQLRAAMEQLAAEKQAREQMEARLAEQKALNEGFEARFKKLDENLEGDDKRWIPQGVEQHEKEKILALRALGENMYDIGAVKFTGESKFGRFTGQEARSGQSIGTSTEGGNLIAIPILQGVQYIRPTYGLVRELFTIFQMNTAQQDIPINTQEPSLYYVNEKSLPAAESNVPFDTPRRLSTKVLTAYDIMSIEFTQDVSQGVIDFIGERFLIAVSKEEDRVGFVASNSPTGWFGIIHATHKGVGNVIMSGNSFELLTRRDLVNLTRGVDDDDAENGMFCFSRYGLGVIESMVDTVNQPLFQHLSQGPFRTLLGYPYRTSRTMPVAADDGASKPFMWFGNPKRMWFGDYQSIEVLWSSEAAFLQGALVLRLRERFATETVLGAGLARLITHS